MFGFLNKKLVLLMLLIAATCSAGGVPIRGVATPGVEQIFESGGLILLSEKENSISMYNTRPNVEVTCDFFVRIINESPFRQTFRLNELIVTDQCGRQLPIRTKQSILKNKEKAHSVREFFQTLGSTAEAINTYENAGKVKYETSSASYSTTHARVGDRRNRVMAPAHLTTVGRERVKGEYVNESLRRVEIREMQKRQAHERALLEYANEQNLEAVHNFYIDNHTLLPGEVYARNFQVVIPKQIRGELERINVSYFFAGERYNFSYRVGR